MRTAYSTISALRDRRRSVWSETPNKPAAFFRCLPLVMREFWLMVTMIPVFWKHTPYSGFPTVADRSAEGTYLTSYSGYIAFQKKAAATIMGVLSIIGTVLTTLIFTWGQPRTVRAAACVPPYEVVLLSPLTDKSLCVGETFSMQGYWVDSDFTDCIQPLTVTGKRGSTTISTTGGLTIASGTYAVAALENVEDDTTANPAITKTVTAATAGTYAIKFVVSTFDSNIRNITVKNQPGTAGTLTATPDSTTAITWGWADVTNEENYRVRNTSNANISGVLAANTTSWPETGLTANTAYTRRIYSYATVDSGGCNATSADVTGTTAIETPPSVSAGSVTANSIQASVGGSFTNLATGSSGLLVSESVTGTNSGWIQTSSWSKTGLTANTQYSFTAKARNQNAVETASTAAATAVTLAADAGVSGSIPVGSATDNPISFTNVAGFGGGGVQYYRYVFDQNATHVWTNAETQWLSGTISGTPSGNGGWYLHVKAYNAAGAAASSGATLDLGPYTYAAVAPPPDDAILSAPTILAPAEGAAVVDVTPMVTGVAQANADVFLILDGALAGVVKATNHASGTGNFHFSLPDALTVGGHTLRARARAADGSVSPESTNRSFTLRHPFVTPTIATPIVHDGVNPSITIPGLAYEGSTILVYLNDTLYDTLALPPTDGTTPFSYTFFALAPGTYTVHVVARDATGAESAPSESVTFTIASSTAAPAPVFRPQELATYVVEPGDSLWVIAERFYGDGLLWTVIADANVGSYPTLAVNPGLIQPGWALSVPPP